MYEYVHVYRCNVEIFHFSWFPFLLVLFSFKWNYHKNRTHLLVPKVFTFDSLVLSLITFTCAYMYTQHFYFDILCVLEIDMFWGLSLHPTLSILFSWDHWLLDPKVFDYSSPLFVAFSILLLLLAAVQTPIPAYPIWCNGTPSEFYIHSISLLQVLLLYYNENTKLIS